MITMNEAKAEGLCNELRLLTKLGPGNNDVALRRVRSIVSDFIGLGGDYTSEKAGEVLEDFEMWFTPRRWQRFGDHSGFTVRLYTAIEKLSNAADTWLRRTSARGASG